jgi:hypothetical protein
MVFGRKRKIGESEDGEVLPNNYNSEGKLHLLLSVFILRIHIALTGMPDNGFSIINVCLVSFIVFNFSTS